MKLDSIGNIEKNNPLEKAKKQIETTLVGMDEKMDLCALEASMIRSRDGTFSPVSIVSDASEQFTKEEVQRFYKIDSGYLQGVRNFTFESFGNKIPIEYRIHKKVDESGNLVDISERFSEKYSIKIKESEFVFESLSECSQFMFNICRALDYKKQNEPVIYSVSDTGRIKIQTVQKKKDKLKVKKSKYYWKLDNINNIGLGEGDDVLYREKDSYTTTDLEYNFFEDERNRETNTHRYLQKHQISNNGLNEAEIQIREKRTCNIHKKIEEILNN